MAFCFRRRSWFSGHCWASGGATSVPTCFAAVGLDTVRGRFGVREIDFRDDDGAVALHVEAGEDFHIELGYGVDAVGLSRAEASDLLRLLTEWLDAPP